MRGEHTTLLPLVRIPVGADPSMGAAGRCRNAWRCFATRLGSSRGKQESRIHDLTNAFNTSSVLYPGAQTRIMYIFADGLGLLNRTSANKASP